MRFWNMGNSLAKVFIVLVLFIILCNSVNAADIGLGKDSDKSTYKVGDTVTYTLKVNNPDDVEFTVDVYDEWPDGNTVLNYNGELIADDLTLAPGGSWSIVKTYVVQQDDIAGDEIWNYLYVEGTNADQEPITAMVSKVNKIEEDGDNGNGHEAPLLGSVGLIGLIGMLSVIVVISLRKR